MRPLPTKLITRLDLKHAALCEAAATRNLLPPEPDWTSVRNFESVLQDSVRSKLAQGMAVRQTVEVSARKSRHGLRPIPFMAIDERVAYTALVETATSKIQKPSRDPKDWVNFTQGPIEEAEKRATQESPSHPFSQFPFRSSIRYVVKSDVVAYYRHVDHELLRDQLTIHGGDFEAIGHLIELLGELQGRPIGLPQVHRSSDILAEIYIDAVERAMLRNGYAIWRYNDDFRIACNDFTHAMRAIEDLDLSLRRMGLTLNEAKTTTPTFSTYYIDHMGLTQGEDGVVIKSDEPEDVVGDYTDDFSEEPDRAANFLAKLSIDPDEDGVDLRTAGLQEMRMTKRALSGLSQNRDPRGLEKAVDIVRYMAPITPNVMRYLAHLAKRRVARTKLADVLDRLAFEAATNDWQKIWLIHTYCDTGVLSLKKRREERVQWIRRQLTLRSHPGLRAYATWTLSKIDEIDADSVFSGLKDSPETLAIFYAAAAAEVGRSGKGGKLKGAFAEPLLKQMASI